MFPVSVGENSAKSGKRVIGKRISPGIFDRL